MTELVGFTLKDIQDNFQLKLIKVSSYKNYLLTSGNIFL